MVWKLGYGWQLGNNSVGCLPSCLALQVMRKSEQGITCTFAVLFGLFLLTRSEVSSIRFCPNPVSLENYSPKMLGSAPKLSQCKVFSNSSIEEICARNLTERISFLENTYPAVCPSFPVSTTMDYTEECLYKEERKCQTCLTSYLRNITDSTQDVANLKEYFNKLLDKLDCARTEYSVIYNCRDCREAYENWLCSRRLRLSPPLCRSLCPELLSRCPYLLQKREPQSATGPVFYCGHEMTQAEPTSSPSNTTQPKHNQSCLTLCQETGRSPDNSSDSSSSKRNVLCVRPSDNRCSYSRLDPVLLVLTFLICVQLWRSYERPKS